MPYHSFFKFLRSREHFNILNSYVRTSNLSNDLFREFAEKRPVANLILQLHFLTNDPISDYEMTLADLFPVSKVTIPPDWLT